jgi:hypothetical protein
MPDEKQWVALNEEPRPERWNGVTGKTLARACCFSGDASLATPPCL